MGLYDESVIAGFERSCKKYPDKPALIYLGKKYSYRKLKEMIEKFATAIYALGVRSNDKVMLYIPNSPQFLVGYFGAQLIGAIPVPVSPIYTPFEINYLINDVGAETIICMDTNFGYVEEIWMKTCLKRVIVTNYVELLPSYKRIIGFLFDRVPKGAVHWNKNEVYSFKKLINSYPPQPPQVDIEPRNHLCYIQYTGGTTGFPKGCPATHTSMVSFVNELQEFCKGYVLDGQEVFIMVPPLFHQMAQGFILGMVLTKGNTAVLIPMPEVDAILQAIQIYKGTLFLGTPTLYRMVLENDRLDTYNLSSLKYCWSGGDVLPLEVFKQWKRKFGLPIYQGYGATEVGFVTMYPMDRDPVIGSIGSPLPSREYMVVEPDTMKPVIDNTPGELLITSEYISKSYWNKPLETGTSYVEIGSKIWYRTKDIVRIDEEGLFYFVDKGADVIKYKGYRVSCSEIEAVLQDHPSVIEACVVGVPDAKVGERIKAIVVLKEGAKGVNAQELMVLCRERLAPYKVPKYIEFRDMLPKSKVGKLLRREIREEERMRTVKGASF